MGIILSLLSFAVLLWFMYKVQVIEMKIDKISEILSKTKQVE